MPALRDPILENQKKEILCLNSLYYYPVTLYVLLLIVDHSFCCILLLIVDHSSYKNNKVTPCYVLMNVLPGADYSRKVCSDLDTFKSSFSPRIENGILHIS